MEAWSIRNYRRPYLRADRIRRRGATVSISCNGSSLEITCQTQQEAAQTAEVLRCLCEPGASAWDEVLSTASSPDGSWQHLLSQLDDLQFVGDDMGKVDLRALERQSAIATAIAGESRGIVHAAGTSAHRKQLLTLLSELLATAEALIRGASSEGAALSSNADGRGLPLHGDNIFVAIVRCQLHHFAQSSPASLHTARQLFATALEQLRPDAKRTARAPVPGLGPVSWGLHDQQGVVTHLVSVASSCRAALAPGARRRVAAVPVPESPCSGSAFALLAEEVVKDTLLKLGPSRFLQSARRIKDSHHPLIRGTYVEQYHVTRRFVEIVTPLLAMRLAPGLRALMFRYFFEEYGHEKFEREACLALGISEEELDASTPLPLTTAFVDVLTLLGCRDPLGFMVAVTATEGLHGQDFKISDLLTVPDELKRATGRHDSLNAELNHASIPRLALSQVDLVTPDSQARALNHLVFVLELNHLCWDSLYETHTRQADVSRGSARARMRAPTLEVPP